MSDPRDRSKPRSEPNPALAETLSSEEFSATQPTMADAKSSDPTTSAPATDVGELIGQRIGKYRILRELGSGGMGVVYEAVHESIGQRAAVKVLRGRISLDHEFVGRFFNEARAAVVAQHASLVKLFDYGQLPSGILYMLMEFLEGEPLRLRIDAKKRFSESEAVRLARQIASAIALVHERGIVHRHGGVSLSGRLWRPRLRARAVGVAGAHLRRPRGGAPAVGAARLRFLRLLSARGPPLAQGAGVRRDRAAGQSSRDGGTRISCNQSDVTSSSGTRTPCSRSIRSQVALAFSSGRSSERMACRSSERTMGSYPL